MITEDSAQQLFSLEGRVAFIIGTGSGIGQTIACALVSVGAHVICFDLRGDGGLSTTVDAITAIGAQVMLYTGDVRQLGNLRVTVTLAKECFSRLDIAVNAAGTANANPTLEMEGEQ